MYKLRYVDDNHLTSVVELKNIFRQLNEIYLRSNIIIKIVIRSVKYMEYHEYLS